MPATEIRKFILKFAPEDTKHRGMELLYFEEKYEVDDEERGL